MTFLLTALVSAATIVPAAGYVREKWQETVSTVDFSGEIDQKKPFSVPLTVRNPSQILAMHMPHISCWIDVEYLGVRGDRSTSDQRPSN